MLFSQVAFGRDLACLGDPEFIAMFSLPYRVLQMVVGAMIIRFNYYFAWTLADGANNLAGFGYQVKKDKEGNEKGSWDRITNVDILGVELALNLKGVLDCWNIQTNKWLRYTMYERVKSQAVMKTMLLSALWHGTYPGYYFTFGTASFATEAARKVGCWLHTPPPDPHRRSTLRPRVCFPFACRPCGHWKAASLCDPAGLVKAALAHRCLAPRQ